MPHLSQLFVKTFQLAIAVFPIKASTAERIAVTFHSDLIAVVNTRDAGKRKLNDRAHLKKFLCSFFLAVAQMRDGHFFLALAALSAQDGEDTSCIVRSKVVHQAVKSRFGIMIDEHGDHFAQSVRISRKQKIDDGILQRIIHHAVNFLALEILAAFSVGDLVRSVFPYLADDHGIGILILCRFPQHF